MLVIVGTLVAIFMMVTLIGGLCYIKRTHIQIYSKLPSKTLVVDCLWFFLWVEVLYLNLFFFFFFCVPSHVYGVHHFWWDFCISRVLDQNGISQACCIIKIYHSGLEPSIFDHFLDPTIEIVTFHLHGWCMLNVFFLLAFTHMKVRIFGVRVKECLCIQTRPWFILSPKRAKENGVRTLVNSKGKIPSTWGSEQDWTRDVASCRTVSPTHYQLSYSATSLPHLPPPCPLQPLWSLILVYDWPCGTGIARW